MSEFTELPIEIPVKEVVVALEVDNTWILLEVNPLPIILLTTWDGAEAVFIYRPVKEEDAGAVPILFKSIPPTWLLIMLPPVLAQLIPLINDVFAADVVEEVIIIELLLLAEPIRFPSPAEAPPIFIP
jgi:hypothetical protein